MHYICTGGCKGVSDNPGSCQTDGCPRRHKALEPCECEDGKHNGKHDEAPPADVPEAS